MRSILIVGATVVLGISISQWADAADQPAYKRDVPAKLVSEAKVSEAAAIAAAKRAVPNGNVAALELEREAGKLIYSIDMKVPGAEGVTEVEVDATDGKVIGSEHESEEKDEGHK